MPTIAFTVLGHPEPQGSIRAFARPGGKHPILTSDNRKLKPWRQDVSLMALEAVKRSSSGVSDGAVRIGARFYFAKPKSAPKRITEKLTKPDLDKILRGVLDALTGVAFRDDSQVVGVRMSKHFGIPERAEIEIYTSEEVEDPAAIPLAKFKRPEQEQMVTP